MPKLKTELAQGQAFSRTSEEDGVRDTFTRVFRVVLLAPNEIYDPQDYCGVYIGTRHPFNTNLVCFSFDAKFEGDSRMVSIVTFNYKTFASTASSGNRDDPKTITPEIRPANWTTDTSLMEIPAPTWCQMQLDQGSAETAVAAAGAKWGVPVNPVGDRYEGITKLVPITTIRVEQYERQDPLRWSAYAGYINNRRMTIGIHTLGVHTVMFRSVSCKPHVETFQKLTFRGWIATYEFCYRPNTIVVQDPDGGAALTRFDAGWDRIQIVEGYNVKNVAGAVARADVDVYGLALTHAGYKLQFPLTIVNEAVGKKTKAMLGIPSYDDAGGMVQRPASSPVALNLDGTPRNIVDGTLKPYIQRYQVQNDMDFVGVMNLRLQ